MQGLPASGKTTWAERYIEEHLWYRRVSKDDIREELWFTEYSKENEEIVIKTERERVKNWINLWLNVIVDNTHLIPKNKEENKHLSFYRELAEKLWVDFEIQTMYISFDEAKRRDELRWDDWVWKAVMNKFRRIFKIPSRYPESPIFQEYNKKLDNCVICDLDGTLAFMDWKRSPYDYEKVLWDRYNNNLGSLLWAWVNSGFFWKVIFLSWRDDCCEWATRKWLSENYKPWFSGELLMRKTWDKRKDSIVKKELYEENIKWKYNVVAVFDDRNQVVDMWRKEWLPTYQVWYWDF